MGGSKTKSETKPIYSRELTGAANTVGNVYNQQAPKIQGYADAIGGLIPGMIDRYNQGADTTGAARDYNLSVLQGDYLGSNPYLEDVLSRSNDDVRNQTQAAMGVRGLTGGSDYAIGIADRVNQNSLNTRYNDYNQERARMAMAAGQAPGLDSAALAPAFSAAQLASGLPLDAARGYAGTVGGLLGPYTTQTQTQNPGLFQWAGLGLQGASLLSDARAKENIREVGATGGGLPVYTYNYRGDPTVHMGVMAQDVAVLQPDALGEERGGYMTVDYGKVS